MTVDDIQISTWPPYGTGGQHAGSPRIAVIAWHHESGLGVVVGEERSQFKNKARAVRLLRRLLAIQNEAP